MALLRGAVYSNVLHNTLLRRGASSKMLCCGTRGVCLDSLIDSKSLIWLT